MNIKVFLETWENDRWQRAIWQMVCVGLVIALIVNGVFFNQGEVVIVPTEVERQFWIRDNKASPEYLEQMATFFATFVGNFTPENVDYMVKVFLTYVEPVHYAEIQEAIKAEAEQVKQYKINQTFSVLRTELRRGGVVLVYGQQKRFQGGSLSETTPIYELQMAIKKHQVRVVRFIYHATAQDFDQERLGASGHSVPAAK